MEEGMKEGRKKISRRKEGKKEGRKENQNEGSKERRKEDTAGGCQEKPHLQYSNVPLIRRTESQNAPPGTPYL